MLSREFDFPCRNCHPHWWPSCTEKRSFRATFALNSTMIFPSNREAQFHLEVDASAECISFLNVDVILGGFIIL